MTIRALWLCPIPTAAVRARLVGSSEGSGGWIDALRSALGGQDLDLALACVSDMPFEIFRADGTSYFPLHDPRTSRRIRRVALRFAHKDRSIDYTPQCMEAIDAFRPDVIHVHGTETTLGLVAGRAPVPTLISLQGIIRSVAEHCFDGVETLDVVRDAIRPRSIFRGVGLVPGYYSMRRQIGLESEIIATARFFTGRTAFDRAAVQRVNPGALYYHCDRVLRDEFYGELPQRAIEGPIVYCTGGAAPYKGVALLLGAAAELVRRGIGDLAVRVSGDIEGSPMWPILQRQVNQLGLTGRVSWLGPLAASSVVRELRSCAAFVLPSYIDNSPNALAEAMMCGSACLASAVGGVPSMIRSGENGLLFEPGSVAQLAAAIFRLLKDEDLRRQLGAAARQDAELRHDPRKIAATTMATYMSMLHDSASKSSRS